MKSVSVGLGQGYVRCSCGGKRTTNRCGCYSVRIGCNTKCQIKISLYLNFIKVNVFKKVKKSNVKVKNVRDSAILKKSSDIFNNVIRNLFDNSKFVICHVIFNNVNIKFFQIVDKPNYREISPR